MSGYLGHILEQNGTPHCPLVPWLWCHQVPTSTEKPEGQVEVATEVLEGAVFSLKM